MRSDRKASRLYLGLSVALLLIVLAGLAFSPPPDALERMKERAWLKVHPAAPAPVVPRKKPWPPLAKKNLRGIDNAYHTTQTIPLELPGAPRASGAISTPKNLAPESPKTQVP